MSYKKLAALVCCLLTFVALALVPKHSEPQTHMVSVGESALVRLHETIPTTSTTSPPQPRKVVHKTSRQATHPRYVGPLTDDIFIRLSWCEAGGRPNAVSRSGRYFGAFQFSLATWHSMGMSGNPIDYPYDVQLDTAKRLQARSGWGQWPVCARKLGLR